MTIAAKICGLRDADSIAAVEAGGARYAGFVFYPKSPRAITAAQVAPLLSLLPPPVFSVGLFVDASDAEIESVLRLAPLRLLQLHGKETPERVQSVKEKTGLPVIKVVGISTAQDVLAARVYESVADFLLLDAKPPPAGLPGGNALSFDWTLLKQVKFAKPWFLAGGLNEQNVADAVARTGASLVDVSSGVEDFPGHKNPAKIKAFLEAVGRIGIC